MYSFVMTKLQNAYSEGKYLTLLYNHTRIVATKKSSPLGLLFFYYVAKGYASSFVLFTSAMPEMKNISPIIP